MSPWSERLIRRLAEVPNIAGLKDSTGNWQLFQSLALDPPADFALLQGSQAMSAISLLYGAHGLVPGLANIHPGLFSAILGAARARDWDGAMALQRELNELIRVRGPATLHASKLLAEAMGLMHDHVTSPLRRMDAQAAAELVRSHAAGLPVPRGSDGA